MPHLNYCHMTKRLLNYKKTLRIVFKCNYCTHTDPVFKYLGFIKVNDYRLQQQQNCFKISHQSFFNNCIPVLNANYYQHNTRQRRNFHRTLQS